MIAGDDPDWIIFLRLGVAKPMATPLAPGQVWRVPVPLIGTRATPVHFTNPDGTLSIEIRILKVWTDDGMVMGLAQPRVASGNFHNWAENWTEIEIATLGTLVGIEELPAEICRGCGNEIDPDVCHCGDGPESSEHSSSGGNHGFVPAGCECQYAPEVLQPEDETEPELVDQAEEFVRRRALADDIQRTDEGSVYRVVLLRKGGVTGTMTQHRRGKSVIRCEYFLPFVMPDPRAMDAEWSTGGPLFEDSGATSAPDPFAD